MVKPDREVYMNNNEFKMYKGCRIQKLPKGKWALNGREVADYYEAKRIVDFLSGTLYAIGGDLQKLGGGIFLCTPNNINVEGKITDDSNPTKGAKGKKQDKEEKEEDEEEFNW